MRDRLIELIVNAENSIYQEKPYITDTERIGNVADQLLAEGVIVMPCKVGSDVYFAAHENKLVLGGELVSFSLDAAHLWFNCYYKRGLNIWHPIEDFGKTVFLTREEADKALAERRGK